MKPAVMFVCLVTFLVSACGGGSSNPTPTAPGPSQPTATGLSISPGSGMLQVGSSVTFAATATFSDGTSRQVTANWTTNNSSVVTVDGSGRAVAQGAGMATLTATAEGRTATVSVRGLPDFAGNWRVQVREVTCDVPGRWGAGFCNVSGLVTMTLQLARTDGDRLAGTLNNGIGWAGPVTAQVSEDGTLAVSGRLTSARTGGVTFHSDLNQWQTRLSNNGMTGTFRETLTWVGEQSQGFIANEVTGATR